MGRSRKAIIITLVLAVFVLLALAAPALAQGGEKYVLPRNEYAPAAPDPMDGTHMLGDKDKAVRKLAAQIGVESLIAEATYPAAEAAITGDEFVVTVSDMGLNTEYDETFVVVSAGENGIICVPRAAFDSFDGTYYHFANPSGSWDHYEDLISQSQLDYLLQQFDTTIWDTMSETFGTPLARGDEGQKVWILIHNIQDEAYYDPAQETYVAGYFSSSEDMIANKNMMHIDTYDWANRTGADAARPFLYEGVFAHEYQHLLHFDMDPAEESWVDEGMADLASFLCGFGEDNSHVVYYLVYHLFTPLTFFGGGLENYGACYLFQLYMYEQYGGAPFTKALFEAEDAEGNKLHGIPGVQATLDAWAGGIAFDTVFDRWTIANYVDEPAAGSIYGYENLDLGTADTWGYSIEYALQRYWYPSHRLSLPLTLYASTLVGGAPQPYTAQYFSFNNQKSIKAYFDGVDQAGTAAYSGENHWVSGQGTWAWKSFYKSFAIPAGDTTLSFWTWYDIEEDWDYGYVEVFDQTTGDWTTLPGVDDSGNLVTTDTLPQQQDNPNVPEGREPMDYHPGEWNGFTGNSGGWVHVNMDLEQFAGHDITIYFRSWQDGAFTLQGMYVDDIAVDYAEGVDYFSDFESGNDGWTSPAAWNGTPDTGPWTLDTGLIPNDWQATLLETQWDTTTRYSTGVDPNARNFLFFNLLRAIPATITDASAQIGAVKATASISQQSKLNWVFILSNRADHTVGSDCYLRFTK